ncbi:yrdC domain-containing protein, mitochondrial [Ixodes scapularis]
MRTLKTCLRRLYSHIPESRVHKAPRSMTRIIPVDSAVYRTESSEAQAAADILRNGGIVALPTDTIYGVAALAQNSESVEKLYRLKRRDAGKPIAICVHDADEISRWAQVSIPEKLLHHLFPGAVTAVFQRTRELNPKLNPLTPLVGVRVPNSDFIRQVTRCCGEPLALTSANVSSEMSTLSIQEFQALWPHLDAVFDGGNLGYNGLNREGSTVINFSIPGHFEIIRRGCAFRETKELLERFQLLEV